MSEFTTLVVRGLDSHPRRIFVDGTKYEVECSADGHIPAQVQELEQFVNCARAGELGGMTKKELSAHAQDVRGLSNKMRQAGYGDEPTEADAASICGERSAWSGEGLPPVGTVCEIAASTPYLSIRHPVGAKVKVYANFTDDRGIELAAFVGEAGKVAGVCTARCFRPIRTPEQIAAEERDKAIVEMLCDLALPVNEQTKHTFGRVYDRGYRKQVAP